MIARAAIRGLFGALTAVLIAGCAGAPLRSPTTSLSNAAGQTRALAGCGTHRGGGVQCMTVTERAAAGPDVAGWAPLDFQTRYRLPSSTKGAGEIVAIVDAYDNPNVASDLGQYRTQFGLGTATFAKYNQRGEQKNYPEGDKGWGVEIDQVQLRSPSPPR